MVVSIVGGTGKRLYFCIVQEHKADSEAHVVALVEPDCQRELVQSWDPVGRQIKSRKPLRYR